MSAEKKKRIDMEQARASNQGKVEAMQRHCQSAWDTYEYKCKTTRVRERSASGLCCASAQVENEQPE